MMDPVSLVLGLAFYVLKLAVAGFVLVVSGMAGFKVAEKHLK